VRSLSAKCTKERFVEPVTLVVAARLQPLIDDDRNRGTTNTPLARAYSRLRLRPRQILTPEPDLYCLGRRDETVTKTWNVRDQLSRSSSRFMEFPIS
jgi:hypothetical protein